MSCNLRWMWVIIHSREKLTVLPSHGFRRPAWDLNPVHSIVSVGNGGNSRIQEMLPPLIFCQNWSWSFACVIDGGPASKDTSPSPGLGGRCGAGWQWVGDSFSQHPAPQVCVYATHAGHQSNAEEVRGCINCLSIVLIQNLWWSCNWLKWGCRVVCGFHVVVPSISHPDLD